MGQANLKLSSYINLFNQSKYCDIVDKICAFLLAACPILQHYKGLFYNAAFTTLILLAPYVCLRILPKLKSFKFKQISLVAVLLLYQVYKVIDHGTSITEIGQSGVFAIYFIAGVLGCINLKWVLKSAMCIALMAAGFLILQNTCFYVFGFHVQLVPTGLLIKSADQWILGAQTGLAGITGRITSFYRPSAFFLEPSHAYIYMFPHLFISLFSERRDKYTFASAILITLGLVLCTSGMGIGAAAGAWVLYLALWNEKEKNFKLKNIFRKRNMILIGIMLVGLVIAFFTVPSIRRTVTRIFTSTTGINAISGRVERALGLLADLTPLQWLFGVQDTTHGISYHIPGFMSTVYRFGLIGMIMSYEFYVKGIFKLKLSYCLVSAVIIVTSLFSAHTHSTVGMLYYVMILLYGFKTYARDERLLGSVSEKQKLM